ncbi:MAG: CPBP family intramembrane metalloprotease [Myxococcota bacterium]|nr:CPBP family intramembrane metalloprotease [Myxococcota bacterium]
MRRLRRALSLADSPIGVGLSRPVAIAMAIIATLVVAHDLKLLGDFNYWGGRRDIPPAIAVALFVYLTRNNLDAIGARARPLPSFKFWLGTVVVLALIMTVLIAGTIAVYVALDKPMPPPMLPDYDHVFGAVVDAPLVEESVYRWLFVTGIVAVAPRWAGVVLSGAVFAYLHFVYNNPGPDNFIGGYFFAWMYLRSGSILVPIAFHALANGSLIVLNVIAYHVLS